MSEETITINIPPVEEWTLKTSNQFVSTIK